MVGIKGGRLPVIAKPIRNESIGSFLIRQAHDLHMTVRDLLREMGVERGQSRPLERLSIDPRHVDVDHLVESFGRVPKSYLSMAVSSYAEGSIAGLWRRHHSPLSISLVCDTCLGEGFWDRRWYTGLMSVCVVHERRLHARCSGCGGVRRIDDMVPSPGDGAGLAHTFGGDVCFAVPPEDLPQPTRDDLAANRDAQRLLRAPPGLQSANALVQAVRTVVMLRQQEARQQDGGDLATALELTACRTTSAAVAVATRPMAVAGVDPVILDALRAEEDALVFTRAPRRTDRYRRFGRDLLGEALRYGRATVVLQEQQVHVPEPGFVGETRFVPTMVPREMLGPGTPRFLIDAGEERACRVIAIAAVQPPGVHGWWAATRRIEADETLAHAARSLVARLDSEGTARYFWEEVARIRRAVLARGIDFRVRRALLENAMSLGGDLFARRAADTGVPPLVMGQWLLHRWALFPAMSGRAVTRPPLRAWSSGSGELDERFGQEGVWMLDLAEILGGGDAADDGCA